jgi:hypothetical protein
MPAVLAHAPRRSLRSTKSAARSGYSYRREKIFAPLYAVIRGTVFRYRYRGGWTNKEQSVKWLSINEVLKAKKSSRFKRR